jgi:hypothetical protein
MRPLALTFLVGLWASNLFAQTPMGSDHEIYHGKAEYLVCDPRNFNESFACGFYGNEGESNGQKVGAEMAAAKEALLSCRIAHPGEARKCRRIDGYKYTKLGRHSERPVYSRVRVEAFAYLSQ